MTFVEDRALAPRACPICGVQFTPSPSKNKPRRTCRGPKCSRLLLGYQAMAYHVLELVHRFEVGPVIHPEDWWRTVAPSLAPRSVERCFKRFRIRLEKYGVPHQVVVRETGGLTHKAIRFRRGADAWAQRYLPSVPPVTEDGQTLEAP